LDFQFTHGKLQCSVREAELLPTKITPASIVFWITSLSCGSCLVFSPPQQNS